MWEPRFFGFLFGWLFVLAAIVKLVDQPMLDAGFFVEQCKAFAPARYHCSFPLTFALGFGSLPDHYFSWLIVPFYYASVQDPYDPDGFLKFRVFFMAPIAYATTLVALNFWVWKVRSLLRTRED